MFNKKLNFTAVGLAHSLGMRSAKMVCFVMLALNLFCHDTGWIFPAIVARCEIIDNPDANKKAPHGTVLKTALGWQEEGSEQMLCPGYLYKLEDYKVCPLHWGRRVIQTSIRKSPG